MVNKMDENIKVMISEVENFLDLMKSVNRESVDQIQAVSRGIVGMLDIIVDNSIRNDLIELVGLFGRLVNVQRKGQRTYYYFRDGISMSKTEFNKKTNKSIAHIKERLKTYNE